MGRAAMQPASAGSYARRRRQVTGRSAFPSSQRNVANGSANTQAAQTMGFVLTDDGDDFTFTWQNAYRSAAGASGLGGLANITIQAAVWDGVTTYPLFWPNGSRSMTIEPGGQATTAPAIVRGAKGQKMWLHYRVTWATAPSVFPAATVLALTATEVNEVGTALTDRTTSYGQFFTRTAGNFAVLPPVGITATCATARPVVAILGDSIASDGNNDFNTDEPDYGWAQGGLADAGIPYVNLGQSNMQLGQVGGANRWIRAQTLASLPASGITHLLVALGTNDWTASRTAAQIYADLQLLRDELAPLGVKVVPVTLQPKTNAANNAQAAGETVTFTQRALLNAQIIAGNGVGAGYFDLAAATQNPASTDLWRSDLRTATDISIVSGGSGYKQNDCLILPGGGTITATTVTSGAFAASVAVKGLGGWIADPAATVSAVRGVSNDPSSRGVFAGTGATFSYTGVASTAATPDGTHPSAALTRYVRQQFAGAAPGLFMV